MPSFSTKTLAVTAICLGVFIGGLNLLRIVPYSQPHKGFEYRHFVDCRADPFPAAFSDSKEHALAWGHSMYMCAGVLLVLGGLAPFLAARHRRALLLIGPVVISVSGLFLHYVSPGPLRGFIRLYTDGGFSEDDVARLQNRLRQPETWQQSMPAELASKLELPSSSDWIVPQVMFRDEGRTIDVVIEFSFPAPHRTRATLMDYLRDVLLEQAILDHPNLKVTIPHNLMVEYCRGSLWKKYRSISLPSKGACRGTDRYDGTELLSDEGNAPERSNHTSP